MARNNASTHAQPKNDQPKNDQTFADLPHDGYRAWLRREIASA